MTEESLTDDEFAAEYHAIDKAALNVSPDMALIVQAVLLLAWVIRSFHSDFVRLTR